MRITALIGEPAAGKSTVMCRYMTAIGKPNLLRDGPPFAVHVACGSYLLSLRDVYIVGDYSDPGQQFPGTDRLSMAVQPRVLQWLRENQHRTWSVVWEGARLGTGSLFSALWRDGFDLKVVHVTATPETLQFRRMSERVQSERFLKAKRTQIANLEKFGPSLVARMACNNLQECNAIVNYLQRRGAEE